MALLRTPEGGVRVVGPAVRTILAARPEVRAVALSGARDAGSASVGDALDGPAFYTPSEIAKRWGVTAETVRACIRSGALEAFRVGPRPLGVQAVKLAGFEARRATEAAPPKGREAMTAKERKAERSRDRMRTVVLSGLRVGWARGQSSK